MCLVNVFAYTEAKKINVNFNIAKYIYKTRLKHIYDTVKPVLKDHPRT